MQQDNTLKTVTFFAALCLFLSAVEYAIPKPLPFLRLGLANLPIMLAFGKLRFKHITLLVILKTFGQAIISGTLFSYVFLFSVSGSFAACFGMSLVYYLFIWKKQIPLASYIGMGLAGALFNTVAQFFVSTLIFFGTGASFIAPILFCNGTITGLLLGFFAQHFVSKSKWYAMLSGGSVI